MVRVIKAQLGVEVLEEVAEFGEIFWGPEAREDPEAPAEWVVCPGCSWRIVKSLICSECGEDLSPRPSPVRLNIGRRVV